MKKGEVSTTTIVTVLIIVASFAVLLYFWYQANFGGVANEQVCHNSVVLTALTKNLIGRLNCKTQFVCVSGGGTCISSSDETVKVNVKNKDEVLQSIADKLANCWSTFGEGNINYVSADLFKISNTGCALCYDIKFDDKLQTAFPNGITYRELYDYMAGANMPGTQQTYLYYLYQEDTVDNLLKDYPSAQQYATRIIPLNSEYFVVTGEVRADYIVILLGLMKAGPIHPLLMNINEVSKLNCKYVTKIA
jgi:hypothetical protein